MEKTLTCCSTCACACDISDDCALLLALRSVFVQVLIAKRRKPSYLQVYHHASTILCAYWLTASHATATFLFVGLNSTIHSIMYTYFALATVGIRLPGKAMITQAQLAQFVVGIFAAIPMFVLEDGTCANPAQKFAVAGIILSVLKLIVLFSAFYSRTYRKKAV
jgi:GNS1/SUR4 family